MRRVCSQLWLLETYITIHVTGGTFWATSRKKVLRCQRRRNKSGHASIVRGKNGCEGKRLEHIWTSHVGDVINITDLVHAKAEFFLALALMDTVNGWNETGWDLIDGEQGGSVSGGRLAPLMWIHTRAVICNVQRIMDEFMNPKMSAFMPENEKCRIFEALVTEMANQMHRMTIKCWLEGWLKRAKQLGESSCALQTSHFIKQTHPSGGQAELARVLKYDETQQHNGVDFDSFVNLSHMFPCDHGDHSFLLAMRDSSTGFRRRLLVSRMKGSVRNRQVLPSHDCSRWLCEVETTNSHFFCSSTHRRSAS